MTDETTNLHSIDRRGLLKTAGLAAIAAALPTHARAQVPKKLVYVVWAFEPQVHRDHADRFEAENPGYKVEIVTVTFRDYLKKVAAMMSAGEQIDAMLVYNFHVAAWSEAGYLQAIDGLPGLDQLNGEMFPFVHDLMTYKGKQYGLPYYQDIAAFIYNADTLQKAGIAAPPSTLDELKDQSLTIKQKGLFEYPIIFEAKQSPNSMYYYWNLVYGSGGSFFDAALEPTFPERDPIPVRVLEWLVAAVHDWGIVDGRSLEMDLSKIRDTFSAGEAAFTILHRYYLRHINNPKVSKVAGHARMGAMPGFATDKPAVEGWGRLYGMGATAKDRSDAWKLLQFLGGRDKAGTYHTAERWADLQGLGPGYMSVADSPKVAEAFKQWVDLDLSRAESRKARVREISKVTWYPEIDLFMQQQVQRALLRQVSPKDALQQVAAKARELKLKA